MPKASGGKLLELRLGAGYSFKQVRPNHVVVLGPKGEAVFRETSFSCSCVEATSGGCRVEIVDNRVIVCRPQDCKICRWNVLLEQ